jgi:hypothetical protein
MSPDLRNFVLDLLYTKICIRLYSLPFVRNTFSLGYFSRACEDSLCFFPLLFELPDKTCEAIIIVVVSFRIFYHDYGSFLPVSN